MTQIATPQGVTQEQEHYDDYKRLTVYAQTLRETIDLQDILLESKDVRIERLERRLKYFQGR